MNKERLNILKNQENIVLLKEKIDGLQQDVIKQLFNEVKTLTSFELENQGGIHNFLPIWIKSINGISLPIPLRTEDGYWETSANLEQAIIKMDLTLDEFLFIYSVLCNFGTEELAKLSNNKIERTDILGGE